MKIVMMTDPVLRKVTDPVTREELDYVKSLVPEMITTMNEAEGAGLAANQVGISKRFFILKNLETGESKLYINPEITAIGEMLPFQEGCLSIPGTFSDTERAQVLTLKYLDENFEEQSQEYKGFTAAAVQHEVDHLNGKLYIDQLGPVKKNLVVSKHKKYLKLRGRSK